MTKIWNITKEIFLYNDFTYIFVTEFVLHQNGKYMEHYYTFKLLNSPPENAVTRYVSLHVI